MSGQSSTTTWPRGVGGQQVRLSHILLQPVVSFSSWASSRHCWRCISIICRYSHSCCGLAARLPAGPRAQAKAPASTQSQRAGGALEGRMVRPEPAAGGRGSCGVRGGCSAAEWRGPAARALRGAARAPGRAAGARLTGGGVTQWSGGGGASAQVGGGAWAPRGVSAESR